jgi:hypothetical protein
MMEHHFLASARQMHHSAILKEVEDRRSKHLAPVWKRWKDVDHVELARVDAPNAARCLSNPWPDVWYQEALRIPDPRS